MGGDWANGSGPLYRRLADRIDVLIEGAELRDGVRLPAERAIAADLEVSRSTVVAALDLLRERGSVVSRQGSGTSVSGPVPLAHEAADLRSRSIFHTGGELIDLTKACPPVLGPAEELFQRLMREGIELDPSMDPEGIPALRQALANRYTNNCGLKTDPSQILVTSGAQQGVSLVLSLLCRAGDVVLVERCTWPGITDTVARLGGRSVGVSMDHNGIDTAELRSAVERFRPSAIVLNPHHHNPTASRLSPKRRADVANISADYRVPVIEDRVAACLAFDGDSGQPIAGERPDAQIITVDSLSKVLWAGLRLGWVRANPAMMGELRLAKALADMWTSTLSQAVGIGFLAEFDELLEHRNVQLQERMELAWDLIARELPEWKVDKPLGGMVLWAELPEPVARRFIHHAAAHGVRIAGAEAFSTDGNIDNRIRVPFTSEPAELEEAIVRLGQAWRTLDHAAEIPFTPAPDGII